MSRSPHYWLPTLLLFAAAIYLSRQIASAPLWADEAWSLYTSQRPTLGSLLDFLKPDLHPPLFFLILRLWDNLVGMQPLALRQLALWSSLLTVALTYRLGLDLFDRRAGVVAALIMASSDIVFSMTPAIRHYTPYMLLATLSTWAYWRYSSHKSNSLRWMIFYCLSSLALIYTLYWGGLILIAQGLHALIFQRRRLPRFALPAALIAICYLPWLPIFADQLRNGGAFGTANSGRGYSAAVNIDLDGMKIVLFQLFGVPETLFAGLALAGLVGSFAANRYLPTRQTALAGSWLITPLLLPIISGLLGYNLLTHRPLVAMVPPMALLIGHVFSQLKTWQYNLLLGIIVINNLVSTGAEPPPRGDWWTVGDFLGDHLAPQDALLIESDIYAYTIEEHARLADAPFAGVIHARQIRDGWPGETAREVNPLLDKYDSLWLVEFTNNYDIKGELKLMGFAQTTPILDFGFFLVDDIHITRFARPPADPTLAHFGSDFRLQSATVFQRNAGIHVELTWAVDNVPSADYTVSVFLLGADGRLVTQHDSYPLDGKSPTSTWLNGEFYYDRVNLDTANLPDGNYQVGVKLYNLADGLKVLPVSPCEESNCEYAVVESIQVVED